MKFLNKFKLSTTFHSLLLILISLLYIILIICNFRICIVAFAVIAVFIDSRFQRNSDIFVYTNVNKVNLY